MQFVYAYKYIFFVLYNKTTISTLYNNCSNKQLKLFCDPFRVGLAFILQAFFLFFRLSYKVVATTTLVIAVIIVG